MAKNVADLLSFSITQFLEIEYREIDDTEKVKKEVEEILKMRNLPRLTEYLIYRLNKNARELEEVYSIIHNKDSREIFDDKKMAFVIEQKNPHIHACFRFKKGKNKGATVDGIAKILGIEKQYVEKPKSGRYSRDNQLSYLIHAKDEDKYRYDPDEVYTAIGESYIKIYNENVEKWRRGAVKKSNKKSIEDIDYLESKILQGEITKPEVILTDEYYKIYALNKRRVDDAFETYAQRKIYTAIQKLENGEFKTVVYYVMGHTGSGKTVFAKDLIEGIKKEAKDKYSENRAVYKTASTNSVDDYLGEEIVLMDDVRGSTMRADDWLKLLDPYNVSPNSARYKNKTIAARAIIITATIHPLEFFYYTKGVGAGAAQEEAIDQFLRRLMATIRVFDIDKIEVMRSIKGTKKLPKLVQKTKDGKAIWAKSEIEIKPDLDLKDMSKCDIINVLSDEVINSTSEKNDKKFIKTDDEYNFKKQQLEFNDIIQKVNSGEISNDFIKKKSL